MSTISNRFMITALEDGATIHGNLTSDKSLTQMWTGEAAVPNWEIESNQPTIYLTLLNGSTLVAPSDDYTWNYNGVPIIFGVGGKSTSPDGLFQKTTKMVSYGGKTVEMPALKIIGNLAGYGGNVDIDTISFDGSISSSGGGGITFSASTQIRITAMTSSAYIGSINAVDGIADFTERGQTITLYGRLFDGKGEITTGFTTKWYLNDDTTGKDGSNIQGINHAFQLKDTDVIDHAVVRCDFILNGNNACSAFIGIDDMQDPEYMWIQYGDGGNGAAASLRKDESIEFKVWVGIADDPNVIDSTWDTFKVLLIDAYGNVNKDKGLADSIPDPDDEGYRTMTISGGKASIKVHYDSVVKLGRDMTGVVFAYKNQ